MNEIKKISTVKAPEAVGPYSQAVLFRDLIFVSGQIPLDPQTGNIEGSEIGEQTRRCLKNIASVLEAGNSSLDRVLKIEIFLTNMDDFSEMNKVYEEFFSGDVKPARYAVEVSKIPKNALIEIACTAISG